MSSCVREIPFPGVEISGLAVHGVRRRSNAVAQRGESIRQHEVVVWRPVVVLEDEALYLLQNGGGRRENDVELSSFTIHFREIARFGKEPSYDLFNATQGTGTTSLPLRDASAVVCRGSPETAPIDREPPWPPTATASAWTLLQAFRARLSASMR